MSQNTGASSQHQQPHVPPIYHGADQNQGNDASTTSTQVPDAQRTQTRMSVMSRVVSTLPNPEADSANKPGAPHLKKFSYGLFDPEIAQFRGIVKKMLIGVTVMTTLVMWLCTPVYWGSREYRAIHRLSTRVRATDVAWLMCFFYTDPSLSLLSWASADISMESQQVHRQADCSSH